MHHVLSGTLMHSRRCLLETACVSPCTDIQAVRGHGLISTHVDILM